MCSGGPLERGLRRVVNNVAIGSLLIQSEPKTGEPLLLHLALPHSIRDRQRARTTRVFLLDAQVRPFLSFPPFSALTQEQIGTAASAFMAIRVLLDHGVPQENIVFVTFLVARFGGIVLLRKAFPHVKVVCSAVDDHLTERWLECIDAAEGEGLRSPEMSRDQESEGRKVWVVEPGMGHIGKSIGWCVLGLLLMGRALQVIGITCESLNAGVHDGCTCIRCGHIGTWVAILNRSQTFYLPIDAR